MALAPPTPAAAPVGRPSLVQRIFVGRWELWLVFALTTFGAMLRLWHLTSLPYGFHGDEANVALDARRIVEHGWIGAWSNRALGYPIAINYLVAASIKILGYGVLSSRIPMALLGISAIPLMYYVCRNIGGWRTGVCGALLLTLSLWHLHLSRVSFPVIGWATAELSALLCLQYAVRTRNKWWWLGCGLSVGISLWIYNSAFVFAFAVAVWVGAWFVIETIRTRGRGVAANIVLLAILGLSALFAGKPILDYQRQPHSNYSDRFDQVFVFGDERKTICEKSDVERRTPRCQEALTTSVTGRADIAWTHLRKLYEELTTVGRPDAADGLGARPPLGRLAAYLALVGMIVALIRYRTKPPVLIGVMVVPLLMVATALTVEGQYRRTFGMMPFLAIFGGVALGTLWEWADRQPMWRNIVGVAAVWACIGSIGFTTIRFYYGGSFQNDANTRFVFNPDVTAAYEYLNTISHPYVYFWNARASLNYEPRYILAREIAGGEDRSREFTSEDKTAPIRYDLAPSTKPIQRLSREADGAVFVFVGSYVSLIDEVMSRYPGGQVSERFNDHLKIFDYRAYYLSKDLLDRYLAQEGTAYPTPDEGFDQPPQY